MTKPEALSYAPFITLYKNVSTTLSKCINVVKQLSILMTSHIPLTPMYSCWHKWLQMCHHYTIMTYSTSYLELYQVHIHVSVGAVLLHRMCEVSYSFRRGPQPRLYLRQVEHNFPVGPCVQGWGLLVPAVRILFLGRPVTANAGPTQFRVIVLIRVGLEGGGHRGDHRGGSLTGHRRYDDAHGETRRGPEDGDVWFGWDREEGEKINEDEKHRTDRNTDQWQKIIRNTRKSDKVIWGN